MTICPACLPPFGQPTRQPGRVGTRQQQARGTALARCPEPAQALGHAADRHLADRQAKAEHTSHTGSRDPGPATGRMLAHGCHGLSRRREAADAVGIQDANIIGTGFITELSEAGDAADSPAGSRGVSPR